MECPRSACCKRRLGTSRGVAPIRQDGNGVGHTVRRSHRWQQTHNDLQHSRSIVPKKAVQRQGIQPSGSGVVPLDGFLYRVRASAAGVLGATFERRRRANQDPWSTMSIERRERAHDAHARATRRPARKVGVFPYTDATASLCRPARPRARCTEVRARTRGSVPPRQRATLQLEDSGRRCPSARREITKTTEAARP